MMIAAVVVAVGMTEIVGGWGRLMRTRAVVKADWLHLGWSIWILVVLIRYWIGMWAYSQLQIDYMVQILFLIIPTLFGVLAAFAITPDVPTAGELDVREYYWAKRTAVFLPLAAFTLLSYVADLVIVGVDKVGFDLLLITGAGTVLLIFLTITKRLWIHVTVLACVAANTIEFLFRHSSYLDTKWVG
jgi:hypothetical protein